MPRHWKTLLATRLEQGDDQGNARGWWPSLLTYPWATLAQPVRAVSLPARPLVIGIGGATLGGSGKTPVTLALARALTELGKRVHVAGHGYSARIKFSGQVTSGHRAHEVGDEALELTRAGLSVFLGVNRNQTLALAAPHCDVVVLDGTLQTSPHKLARAVLVVDGLRPWGSNACPPLGDLRAPPARLLDAADVVLAIDRDHQGRTDREALRRTWNLPHSTVWATARLRVDPAWQTIRVGLIASMAHPERCLQMLAAHQVYPHVVLRPPPHRTDSVLAEAIRLQETGKLDLWLAPTRAIAALCQAGLRAHSLDYMLVLPPLSSVLGAQFVAPYGTSS